MHFLGFLHHFLSFSGVLFYLGLESRDLLLISSCYLLSSTFSSRCSLSGMSSSSFNLFLRQILLRCLLLSHKSLFELHDLDLHLSL